MLCFHSPKSIFLVGLVQPSFENLNLPDRLYRQADPRRTVAGELRFQQFSVPDMHSSWQALRAIREQYDEIVRNYQNKAT